MKAEQRVRGFTRNALIVLAISAFTSSGAVACGSNATVEAHSDRASTVAQSAPSNAAGSAGIDVDKLHDFVERMMSDPSHETDRLTSATAVKTTRAKLLGSTGESDDSGAPDVPVIVLQLHGTFSTTVPALAEHPREGAVLVDRQTTATVVTMSLSPDLSQTYDVATQHPGNTIIDLAKLGAPMVDIPVH